MRVIVANDEAFVQGGAGKCALMSARGLAKRGVRTTFFAARGPIDPAFDGFDNLDYHLLEMETEAASFGRLIRNSWNQVAYDAMRAEIAKGNPSETILHLHLWKVYLSPSILQAARDAGAHVMVSLHDYHAACPQGQFFNANLNSICTLDPMGAKCLSTHCTRSRTIASKWAEVYRLKVQKSRGGLPDRVKHYGMFSRKAVGILKPFLPSDAKLHLMPYPIQVSQSPRVEAEKNSRFVFSGRLSSEKNPVVLVEAAKKIGAEVRFLGEGPMRSAVEAVGYEKCSISGWLNGDQLFEELGLARALAITSIWYEVNPLAPVEALGRGIPVIASDDTSTVGEIVDGVTGFPFQSKNVNDLAEKMGRFLDDEVTERMSRAAFDRFWANPPTEENHVEKLLKAYEEILGKSFALSA